MKWRTHEGQGSQQDLQQWSRLMQNGQKFESVLWRMENESQGRNPRKWLMRLKPDFHSRFSLVASENFRIRHAQSGETDRTGRKNVFRSVRI